jgi:DnaJ-class molecular chaperone
MMHEVDPQNYRACPRCTGKGRITCEKCKGQGVRIDPNAWHYGYNLPAWAYTTCSKCSDPQQLAGPGRGAFECPKCHGSGDEKR